MSICFHQECPKSLLDLRTNKSKTLSLLIKESNFGQGLNDHHCFEDCHSYAVVAWAKFSWNMMARKAYGLYSKLGFPPNRIGIEKSSVKRATAWLDGSWLGFTLPAVGHGIAETALSNQVESSIAISKTSALSHDSAVIFGQYDMSNQSCDQALKSLLVVRSQPDHSSNTICSWIYLILTISAQIDDVSHVYVYLSLC